MICFDKKNKNITSVDITLFLHQLYTLLKAGIPLVQGCDILRVAQNKIKLTALILRIKHQLEAGKSLSHALSLYPNLFDNMCCQLIYLGEQSGNVDKMLNTIVLNREKNFALKQKVKQALLYPALVISLAFIITMVMLLYVVPHFAELLQEFPAPLPLLTRMLFLLSYILQKWSAIFLLLLTLGIFLAYRYHNKINSLRLEKLPLLGKFLIKLSLVHFNQNLSLLISSGINLDHSLKLLSTHSSSLLTPSILQLQKKINSGQSFYLTIKNLVIFPPLMVEMVKTGEESGCLDTMLLKVAQFYETEIDHFLQQLGQLLEPLIMVVLGVLIGGLVIALYLPIFNLGTAI